jgi:hypothetical protein
MLMNGPMCLSGALQRVLYWGNHIHGAWELEFGD